ncbi:glutathione-disulfide reductase [Roseovarius sp. SCSIO 43702]|uniref:glutathione-disulfide reductase n=1 Tax=Roseovarius sp. SCSIO 43702 TaxID=2823043 RepID=UPI001C73CAC1|nr:glutathione-disulfide reductase [Roseovarius sp. SCSIO 43702]QYX57945.1 glutathione-disulfide reductase [Roseovarius sp. SCSIO 43702]
MTFDYDLFVIGGGSGGVRAARVAAQAGAKVALAEEDRYGGTCVIRGCVPKKLMVYASSYPQMMREAQEYGWTVHAGGFDWTAFRGKLHAELDRLEGIYRNILSSNGVETFDTRATVKDAHTVRLASGGEKTAKHILIAVGGHPVKPDLPGAEHGLTSNDIFHLETLPRTMLIIGGGYIACEFACILNGLGVHVTQYYHRETQVLRGFDDEARNLVAEGMRASGVNLELGADISEMTPIEGGYRVTCRDGETREFEQVLFATGRKPNTGALGLEDTGVELGDRGEIVVDDYSQTAVPSIYAIGDVTDRVNLTPVAIREGMAFVETVFNGRPTPVDHKLIPTAIFTQPEMGTIGLTEEEAREAGEIEVYATSFKPMRQSFAGQDEKVLMKLVVSKKTRRIVGCHIVAPEAGEMIQLVGIAIKNGATKEEFDRTCAVHPTMTEELVTMREPRQDA